MTPTRIRLIVFDMGGTLWEEVPDERAVPLTGTDGELAHDEDVFYQIDADHMFRHEGVSNRIYPGVRELFDELFRRDVCVSINSLNTPHAWRWIEADFYDLNRDGFVKHSRIGEHPDPECRTGSEKTSIKGIWMREIIDEWNAAECRGSPIVNEQVLFVDDDEWNHRAVHRVCPGVRCEFPPVAAENGMLDLLRFVSDHAIIPKNAGGAL